MALKILDVTFNAFGIGQKFLGIVRQAITCWFARYELALQAFFQFDQSPVNCRLIDTQRFACRNRALLPCNREKELEVIPVEHVGGYA